MHILLIVTDFVLPNTKPDAASLTVALKLQQDFSGNYPCGREIERCSSGDVYRTHHLSVGSLELSLRGLADIWMQGVKIVLRGSVSIEIGQYAPPLWCQQDIDFSLLLKCLSCPPSTSVETTLQCLYHAVVCQPEWSKRGFPRGRHCLDRFI